MDFSFPQPVNEQFAKLSGLALVVATLLTVCSALVV